MELERSVLDANNSIEILKLLKEALHLLFEPFNAFYYGAAGVGLGRGCFGGRRGQ